jgi:transposase
MPIQVEIAFEQLLKIIKHLPPWQLHILKEAIGKEFKVDKSIHLESLLLNGPTASKKQLRVIYKNRKAINEWRSK